MTSQPAERLRRPSDEVQGLILSAARESFQLKGYGGTTTKEIAVRAGVAEALLFTNFGSKARLFEQAVAEPFDEFVADYIRSWREMAGGSTDTERIEGFIRGLLDLTERHRGLLADAIAPSSGAGSDRADGARNAVVRAVSRAIQRVHTLDHGPHPWTFEPDTILAATTGMVMSTVLLDPLLFSADRPRPDRDVLVRELTRFMLYGLTGPVRPEETQEC